MKRTIASIGLLLIACQVALGSTGAIFLCLCATHETPCALTTPIAEAAGCCERSQTAKPKECADLLITSEEIEAVEFTKEPIKLPALNLIAAFKHPQLPKASDLLKKNPEPTKARPCVTGPQRQYTQSIKLLL